MNNNVDHIDDLIGKYLAGEAGRDEIEYVEVWARESEVNKRYLDQCKLIFDRAAATRSIQGFDADAAWSKMEKQLHSARTSTVALNRGDRSFGAVWRIAASVILLLGVGYVLYFLTRESASEKMKVIAGPTTVADTLPDGSKVFLNKGTELSYVFDKSSKHHKVTLKGEAFFQVSSQDKNQFMIEIDGVFIKDIGTAFNVKAYPEKNTIEVVVTEGTVLFYTSTDSGIYLSENGKGVYDKLNKRFEVEQPEANVLSYKTRFFTFSDLDLHAVVAELNQVYHKKIILDKNLKNCRLTVSFNNENIDEIAAIIAETLGLTITASADEIRLEGSGCEN